MYNNSEDKMASNQTPEVAVVEKGGHKKIYHFLVTDKKTNNQKYYFNMTDICDDHGMSLASCFNMANGKVLKKFKDIEIKRIKEHVLKIDYGLSDELINKIQRFLV